MIDKQLFHSYFGEFENELIVEIIDMALEQIPGDMSELKQNIDHIDFIHLKLNACKIRGIFSSLCDPAAAGHARNIENTAGVKMDEIIRVFLDEFPGILDKLETERAACRSRYLFSVLSSPKDFLTGLIGPFSDENSLKLENLEKRIIADGFPQMLSELESSSKSFLEELKVLRQELIIR